jgi:hypothetical protein
MLSVVVSSRSSWSEADAKEVVFVDWEDDEDEEDDESNDESSPQSLLPLSVESSFSESVSSTGFSRPIATASPSGADETETACPMELGAVVSGLGHSRNCTAISGNIMLVLLNGWVGFNLIWSSGISLSGKK